MITNAGPMIAHTAVVHDLAWVGYGTEVWHFCNIQQGAYVGAGCTIGSYVNIGPNVRIGDRCRVQNHVSIFEGVTLEDDVFVGPGATFTNVKLPKPGVSQEPEPTIVRRGAMIGANATILPGITIGEYAVVGAGSVVTRDVPAHTMVYGNPARAA